MAIKKSSRHQHIIGKYGEWVICNWLSRSDFEVAVVDHTGIDLIAFNKKTKERLGISVKSRTRGERPNESVNLFNPKKSVKLLENACNTFGCMPWIAVYVECAEQADIYMIRLDHYIKKYGNKGKRAYVWNMSNVSKQRYNKDPDDLPLFFVPTHVRGFTTSTVVYKGALNV